MDNELAVLGAALLLAGLFARLGRRLGLPTIPFFTVAGIVFGPPTQGIVVLEDPHEIELLAMLGLVLLLFHLGIEFSINELLARRWMPSRSDGAAARSERRRGRAGACAGPRPSSRSGRRTTTR
jgi:Kef-type K+ transport system membrane component KefB